jgi:hypothetical protein
VNIVRLVIVAVMQLLLSCMQCVVVLATATVLGPTSSSLWCLHSDQHYKLFTCIDIHP